MKKPIIEFNNFSFKYNAQTKPTLNNINLTIYEGEKVLIVGPSGSGKSTISNCINGLIPFRYKGDIQGSLKIKGIETRYLSIAMLSNMVGTVLQDPDSQFIGLTVGEDIAFKLENDCVDIEEMKRRVRLAAEIVDIDKRLDSAPNNLSGGQKQRVSLAGTMVGDAEILLFDEPLANLDPATGKTSIELIDKIKRERNKTIIIIEHRLEDVLHCDVDRVIIVDNGTILADMPPNKLLCTEILKQTGIREPLYITALKYAGVKIDESMHPEDINILDIDKCNEKLKEWFRITDRGLHKEEAESILEVKNVDFSYNGRRKILNNLSFDVKKGEMLSVIGKNGAGKSTISKLICGFYKPTKGDILYKGKSILKDSIKERAEKIGMVMQNPNQMISKTMIFDEVALGLRVRGVSEDEVKERVFNTLKVCGLFPFRNWPISALSFGQKKRVTIASILVLNPDIIILDEPTAGQDFNHYTEIMEFLKKINERGITIIMITHDMHLMVEYTDRAVVLCDGEKIADDEAINILTDDGIIKKANLKETSVYQLAVKAGIEDPKEFSVRFVDYDRRIRNK